MANTFNTTPVATPASADDRPNAVQFSLARVLCLVDSAVAVRCSNRPAERFAALPANDDSKVGRSA
ncbi:hypothetical protein RDV64_14170 [Acuticoccus sp. MNP-M23]|uniref:hypothetical protein n=1 Tax=Acuticoccus sp. MNP-M23 TaxID=3072793 RepID=UPI00281611B3|nr:hypothetical protein [Acuticoccus sp. MNP-M23]WMS41224.1 hypothetical protein RDV64_14170 [Acuticoccus sp. MNP-M23]